MAVALTEARTLCPACNCPRDWGYTMGCEGCQRRVELVERGSLDECPLCHAPVGRRHESDYWRCDNGHTIYRGPEPYP